MADHPLFPITITYDETAGLGKLAVLAVVSLVLNLALWFVVAFVLAKGVHAGWSS